MWRRLLFLLYVLVGFCFGNGRTHLSENFYVSTCPNLESTVKQAVETKFQQTFIAASATIRLFFHDCFVEGCDASILITSSGNNTAEKDASPNLSLAGDGFDTVIKAKQAVEEICPNLVSCADILALATRDVIGLTGGPSYSVQLGRRDGLVSMASRVPGKLPEANFTLDQLNTMFASHGLSQIDMVALSGAHTVGFSHCNQFANRIYSNPVDPSLNLSYVTQLQQACPKDVDPSVAIDMDPITPRIFDNVYYQNLQFGKGLFTSDEVLFTDSRSTSTVNSFASNTSSFESAFITAITRLGGVGVKTGRKGEIRRDCSAFNQ